MQISDYNNNWTYSDDLAKFLFPVGLHSIFFDGKALNPRQPHENKELDYPMYAERFLAVVDEEFWNMLSCVSPSYNLLENKWAYNKGVEVAKRVFQTTEDNIRFHFGALSKYRAACRMDLIVSKTLQINDVNHKWYGLVEVANSYDKTCSLGFKIGFMMETMEDRKIPIGLLIPSLSLNFTANHLWTQSTIERKLDGAIYDAFKGRNVILEFENIVRKLLQIEVVDDEILSLFCRLAHIHKPDPNKENDRILAFEVFKIERSSQVWIDKCGSNAYAALCAYADFVSQKPENDSFLPEPTEFQSQLGSFVDELIEASSEFDFSLDDFIGKQAREVRKQIKLICTSK